MAQKTKVVLSRTQREALAQVRDGGHIIERVGLGVNSTITVLASPQYYERTIRLETLQLFVEHGLVEKCNGGVGYTEYRATEAK